ncbi:Tetraspanin-1 [Fasciola hepatica]|uniref:Tetraspanin-1 n=1 Tax=Fasciola hepatica TaxID=6192 RepID=A0A4E0RTX9_FASHE|nr:Tetraspanin-1 [Fasciola hepatica]
MSFCFSFSKLILFVLNFLFVLIGLIIFAVGVWTAADSTSILETIAFFSKTQSTVLRLYANTEFIYICAWVLIAIGALVFILSFVGCWVVVSENRILLIVYTSLMCLVVLFEVVAVILLFALKSTWEAGVTNKMSKIFSENYVGTMGAFEVSEFDPFSLAADSFMIQFSCCGINGPDDFKAVNSSEQWHLRGRRFLTFKDDQVALPTACCKFTETTFFENQKYGEFERWMTNNRCPLEPAADFHQDACKDVIPVELEKQKLPLILAPVIFLVLELTCIGIAIGLTIVIKRLDDELYY